MKKALKGFIKWGLATILVCLSAFLGIRAYVAWTSPPLALWHTFVPQELTVSEMDSLGWKDYLQREERLFDDVRREVTDKLPPEARVQSNRYYSGARIYPQSFAENWNRSYEMIPEGKAVGAVVLLHGLTDAPYSLRHIARLYRDRGFVAIGLRIPGHGTVPAGLTQAAWEDWMAATRLAVREAKKRIPPEAPLHIVGFSNGGALAMKYALDVLEDPNLPRADRLVLLSPMIGITRFARFAGIAALPAFFPAFAKSAWLSVLPEFNPFKYNSFPVNAARQSHRLTRALQSQMQRLERKDVLLKLPPVLTFQSVIDYTVSTPAILYALYDYLPDNGSELVLFDVNRATFLGPLMRSASSVVLSRIIPSPPRQYSLSIVMNAEKNGVHHLDTVSRTTPAGNLQEEVRDLKTYYPPEIFSLSHVSIPFPMDDPLYGMNPPPGSDAKFGINLGVLSARGERGALVVNLDSLFRTTSNPFFDYMMERIEAGILDPSPKREVRFRETGFAVPHNFLSEEKEFLEEAENRGDYGAP